MTENPGPCGPYIRPTHRELSPVLPISHSGPGCEFCAACEDTHAEGQRDEREPILYLIPFLADFSATAVSLVNLLYINFVVILKCAFSTSKNFDFKGARHLFEGATPPLAPA